MSLRDAREWLAETLDALAAKIRPPLEETAPRGLRSIPLPPEGSTLEALMQRRVVDPVRLVRPLCAACAMGATAGHTCDRATS